MLDERSLVRPVILCGGAGTRLWPFSRQAYPKQLLAVVGEESLLQQTVRRVSGGEFEPILVVSRENQGPPIKQQLDATGAHVQSILLEPEARNTSAAAALAAAWLMKEGLDELMLIMPSDHVIGDREAFLAAIEVGIPEANQGKIVTFGARPGEPNTQYGYIEVAADVPAVREASPIVRFVEKPNSEKAVEYFASGRFFWNCGIFLVRASILLEQMRKFLPATLEAIVDSVAGARSDDHFVRPDAEAFARAENISIDHAIMEKTTQAVVVPVSMNWSDVGSWDVVWKLEEQDLDRNVIRGDVVAIDTCGSLIRNNGGPLVTTIGVENLMVIAMNDAVFIAPLSRASDVKEVVKRLQAKGRNDVL